MELVHVGRYYINTDAIQFAVQEKKDNKFTVHFLNGESIPVSTEDWNRILKSLIASKS